MKTAIVWSGGSIKIVWEAGVARALLRFGPPPDVMVGTSAGAIVTGFFSAFQPTDPKDWPAVGEAFAAFLIRNLTGPGAVATKRGIPELLWRYLVSKNWQGLVSMDPLEQLMRTTFAGKFPATGPMVGRVCAVNLKTAEADYFGSDRPDFVDAILASTAEPISMPIRKVGEDWYEDGGCREIAPLGEAIRQGADRIVCVVCQPEKLSPSDGPWTLLGNLLGRTTSMATTEIVNDDIKKCGEVNAAVSAGTAAPGKRHIDLTVIRPAAELPIALESFTAVDVAAMIARGERDALRVLAPSEPGMPQAA